MRRGFFYCRVANEDEAQRKAAEDAYYRQLAHDKIVVMWPPVYGGTSCSDIVYVGAPPEIEDPNVKRRKEYDYR